jgi:hypothetical protein
MAVAHCSGRELQGLFYIGLVYSTFTKSICPAIYPAISIAEVSEVRCLYLLLAFAETNRTKDDITLESGKLPW